MSFDENFYILNCHSYIKNIPTNFCLEFLNELKNDDGTLKPHVEKITYKSSDGDTYFISHDEHLYGDSIPNMEALKSYQKATSYGFASQVTQEIKDIVEAFHNGYGCECLSSGDY